MFFINTLPLNNNKQKERKMIETIYELPKKEEKSIRKLVMNKNGQYIHMTFLKGDRLPLHQSNAELFMTVIRGTLSLGLNDQAIQSYPKRTMINIPYDTKMNVQNTHDETLELLVIKVIPTGKTII